MNAQITEKFTNRTIQFAWEEQILYLHVKIRENGKKNYEISNMPEPYVYDGTMGILNTTGSGYSSKKFTISMPLGALETNYGGIGVKQSVKINKDLIDRNIQYLSNVHEILDYIQNLEDESENN